MNFLKTLGGYVAGSSSVGGLPYVIDYVDSQEVAYIEVKKKSIADNVETGVSFSLPVAPVQALHELQYFELYAGHHRSSTSQAVSIFKSRSSSPDQLIQNALRCIKTLRHPNILSYFDGVEIASRNAKTTSASQNTVWIVTEPVMPLRNYLEALREQYGSSSEEFTMSVAWGLRSILQALKFINVDCKILHGRIISQSIFVTTGGDWKLTGFELAGELTSDGPSSFFTTHEQATDVAHKSPEWQSRHWRSLGPNSPSAIDMWSFACLMYYVFNENQVLKASNIDSGSNDLASNIPHALRTQYRKALDRNNPGKRPTPEKFVSSSFFDTPFIQRMDFLEHLAVKNTDEKSEFYRELSTNMQKLPIAFGLFKVLPALQAVIDFGAASGPKSGPVRLDPSASHMLPVLVQIGSLFPDEEFKSKVLPTIIKMFSCHDRAVRVQLLQMMEKFSNYFDAKLVNSSIVFDNICSGFTDTSPVVRELTVKSILQLVDKLSEANLNTRVMKYFAKLQTDPEPAIRTNTTICIGRLASKMNESTRAKVLLPAFTRAIRDPFPHARLAGLKSMSACESYFSSETIAATVLPVMAPLLLDVSRVVRDQAATSFECFSKKVKIAASEMNVRDDEQIQQEKLQQQQNSREINANVGLIATDGAHSRSDHHAAESASIVGSKSCSDISERLHDTPGMSLVMDTTTMEEEFAWGEDDDLDFSSKVEITRASHSRTAFSSLLNSESVARAKSHYNGSNVDNGSNSLDMSADVDDDTNGWGSDGWGGDKSVNVKKVTIRRGVQARSNMNASVKGSSVSARHVHTKLAKDEWDDWSF
uniref:Nterminal kinaselike protein putative n=1 Tax=Albugo laibachii Nc14 TaxID=890382 RepID=F0WGU0_9STRA|nr:Nterminal kinaselike protein putative [Albugo laibachii Nc14]|eukprot:CCA20455.1 Nterminal kinaselike protein putative [Albugo laibachii Nc14]